jgi:flagellar protein FlaF
MRHYQNPGLQAATPQESEAIAFAMCNAALGNITDGRQRVQVLLRNHQLWSMIVKDVAKEANGLPAELKRRIGELGLWAMRYSVAAMARDLSLEPLMQVNQDMIDGLRAQTRQAPATPVPVQARVEAVQAV